MAAFRSSRAWFCLIGSLTFVALLLSSAEPARTSASRLLAVGPGTYQDSHSAIIYTGSWTLVNNDSASGGTFHRSETTGDTATLEVNGAESFTVALVTGPGFGKAAIRIDGSREENYDAYTESQTFVEVGPYALSDSGTHTIEVKVTGNKNEAANSSN
jgi:hypothetical protein